MIRDQHDTSIPIAVQIVEEIQDVLRGISQSAGYAFDVADVLVHDSESKIPTRRPSILIGRTIVERLQGEEVNEDAVSVTVRLLVLYSPTADRGDNERTKKTTLHVEETISHGVTKALKGLPKWLPKIRGISSSYLNPEESTQRFYINILFRFGMDCDTGMLTSR